MYRPETLTISIREGKREMQVLVLASDEEPAPFIYLSDEEIAKDLLPPFPAPLPLTLPRPLRAIPSN